MKSTPLWNLTDVSEERIAFILRVDEKTDQAITVLPLSCRIALQNFSTLKMGAIRFSETSITFTIQHDVSPEYIRWIWFKLLPPLYPIIHLLTSKHVASYEDVKGNGGTAPRNFYFGNK
jgi:hypothetical protein